MAAEALTRVKGFSDLTSHFLPLPSHFSPRQTGLQPTRSCVASRRSRYKRIFKENIKNQSDYGLIVIWDIENGTFEEKYIVYDHEKKESSLSDYEEYILENISNVDYNGRNYYKSAKKRKLKINPILGTDELKNKQKIQVLYNRYKFRAFIKKLIRR